MKKRAKILLLIAALLLVLTVPIPQGPYKDGGTREWRALTYRVIRWNRLSNDGAYRATRLYFGRDCFRTVDELWAREYDFVEHTFTATVTVSGGDRAEVVPVKESDQRLLGDRVAFNAKDIAFYAPMGSVVDITYVGGAQESYPVQIRAVDWAYAKDLRHLNYVGTWLDRETAQRWSGNAADLVITEIYADCFFAQYVIPMPYTVKVNGTLGEDWCIGDQVLVTYDALYESDNGSRQECDMRSIEVSTFEMEPFVAYKPVIYLYPEEETEVSVRLKLNGRLTCTYPAYGDGWRVTASPDGTLRDAEGQTYSYLYWEGETDGDWDMSQGFCVPGRDTAAFLEETLAALGLTRREANEFIVYWLPLMEESEYNLITFQRQAYTDAAALEIHPAPDTLLRIFMVWQPSDTFVALPPQELTAPERTGFTAVEWGGACLG